MHLNDGSCQKCLEILNRYPGINQNLNLWILNLQRNNPDAHVSCAGRGMVDQEAAFHRGASKAHYGESSHNYNCAVDIFQLSDGKAVWDREWFDLVVGANLADGLKWYGAPGAVFYELPHVELTDWKLLVKSGDAKLVEDTRTPLS